jgi:hypothetical protein
MHRLNAGGRIFTFYHSIQKHLAGPWPSYVAGLTQGRKLEGNSILYIPPVMTRRVGPERSIVDRARGAKIGRSGGGEGKGSVFENVSHDLPWRLKETLHACGLGAVEGGPITAPKVALFYYPFTGT